MQDDSFIEQELRLVEPKALVPNRVPFFSGGLKGISWGASRVAERETIPNTLQHTHWNRTLTAQILQISYKILLYTMQETGLSGPDREHLYLGGS